MRKSLRFKVLERDQFRCRYCGKAAPDVILHVDHVHPKWDGGLDELDNLVTACVDCNLGKGRRKLRPIPGPKRRYNVRTPSREVDMEALRVEFPEGSHCATPLKIATIAVQFGLPSYGAGHRYLATFKGPPLPPLRRTDYAWTRIVEADPYHQESLLAELPRRLGYR